MKRDVVLPLLALVVACGRGKQAAVVTHADSAAASNTPYVPDTANTVGAPAWLARQFYSSADFDVASYSTEAFTKELGGHGSPGKSLRSDVKVSVRPLRVVRDTAVYATTMTVGKPARVVDFYTFMVRAGGGWKIDAVRRLELSKMFNLIADSVGRRYRIVDAPHGVGVSMHLALGSDAGLKAYLLAHRAALDSVVAAFNADRTAPIVLDVMDSIAVARRLGDRRSPDPHANVHRLLENANVSSVYRGRAYPGCVFVRVSGEQRSQVGYIRTSPTCKAPVPNKESFIYVEHVVGPWYAFKAI